MHWKWAGEKTPALCASRVASNSYKSKIKSGYLSFSLTVLITTWASSQQWVFNVVLDWKVLYKAGLNSLLTNVYRPKATQGSEYSEPDTQMKSKEPVGNRSGLVPVSSCGVFCPLSCWHERSCIYYMKSWVRLIVAIETIENWKGVNGEDWRKAWIADIVYGNEVFSLGRNPWWMVPRLFEMPLFQRWANHIACLTSNQKSTFEAKAKKEISAAKSSLVWYLRIIVVQ